MCYLRPKAILVEHQWCFLTHSKEDKGVHTFPKNISLKVNIIVRLKYELAYIEMVVQLIYIYIYIYIYKEKDRERQTHAFTYFLKHIYLEINEEFLFYARYIDDIFFIKQFRNQLKYDVRLCQTWPWKIHTIAFFYILVYIDKTRQQETTLHMKPTNAHNYLHCNTV